MMRHLLAAAVLACLALPFGGGCSDKNTKGGDPKVMNPPKDGGPKPLGAPSIAGGGGNQGNQPKPPGPKGE